VWDPHIRAFFTLRLHWRSFAPRPHAVGGTAARPAACAIGGLDPTDHAAGLGRARSHRSEECAAAGHRATRPPASRSASPHGGEADQRQWWTGGGGSRVRWGFVARRRPQWQAPGPADARGGRRAPERWILPYRIQLLRGKSAGAAARRSEREWGSVLCYDRLRRVCLIRGKKRPARPARAICACLICKP
jgi:hypothetical protein